MTAPAVAVLALVAALPLAPPPRLPETVACRVLDGTALSETGTEVPVPGAAVLLVDAHATAVLGEATAGEDGVARFEGVSLSPGHYRFRADREGIPYFSDPLEVEEGSDVREGRILAYAATSDRTALVIAAHHLLFRSHPGSEPPVVVVQEVVSVENRGARTVRSEPGLGGEHGFTYLARLPPAAGSVQAFLGNTPIPLEGGMGTYPLDLPFTPGRTSFFLEYVLSLTKTHDVPWEPAFPVERLTVVVFDPDETPVEVRGLPGPASREHEGARLDQYDSSGAPDARAIEIRVLGPSRIGYWAAVAAAVLAAVGLASLGTHSGRRRPRVEARDLLQAIAHLDLAFERGGIPKEEYEAERKALLARAVAAWGERGAPGRR